MISTVFILGAIVFIFLVMQFHLFRRYFTTRAKPNLYFGFTCFLWALACVFGILIAVATASNSLPFIVLFYRASSTFGLLAYVLLNAFASALSESADVKRGMWTACLAFLALMLIIWGFDPHVEGTIEGTTEFTLTSTYKAPQGLPLIEIVTALMALIAVYPLYILFRVSKVTKDIVVRLKSLLMAIGIFMGTMAYSVEVTGAFSYHFISIYRPLILLGALFLYFGYTMPKPIQRKLTRGMYVDAELVNSLIKEFFQRQQPSGIKMGLGSFSRKIGLTHEQLRGRKILLEFDPKANYEKIVQDYVNEALSNGEHAVVFTRKGSPIYSILSEKEGVKFFCMTRQVSNPRFLSEREILLPSNNTPLVLSIFDRLLKSDEGKRINFVFDSLSDLVLSLGFKETYKFVRSAVEILSLPTVTAIFLLNSYAHDPYVRASLTSLFGDQISFSDSRIKTIKLSDARYT